MLHCIAQELASYARNVRSSLTIPEQPYGARIPIELCFCFQAEEDRIFQQARASGKYGSTAYMMENNEEFWAEASQAWFEATLREDVTSGLRTKQQALDREPELAQLMIKVYGDTDWLHATWAVRQLVCKKGGHFPSLRVQKVPVAKIKEQLGPSMTQGVAQRRRRFIGNFFTCFAA